MFRLMKWLSRAYLQHPVVFSPGSVTAWLESHADVTIVTSSRAHAAIKPFIGDKEFRVISDPPIEIAELDLMIPSITTGWIAGIGAGRVMDASKYLAFRSKRKLCLIPSALSTTSWLNMAIALRKEGKLHFPGNVHARSTIVDPEFISKAPMALTLGGLVDILAACSAVTDWVIAHENTGEKISARGAREFKALMERILSNRHILKGDTAVAIRNVHDTFLEALALCGASFSGRPVEGSEHFLYYLAEEMFNKRFVHGEIIASMMLVSLQLQGTRALIDPNRIRAFLMDIGVKFLPQDLGIERDAMARLLQSARSFVVERNLPFSILNAIDLDNNPSKLESILDQLYSS